MNEVYDDIGLLSDGRERGAVHPLPHPAHQAGIYLREGGRRQLHQPPDPDQDSQHLGEYTSHNFHWGSFNPLTTLSVQKYQ